MNRTYNGRFPNPPEPRGGGKWVVGGLLMMPLWSVPVLGMGVLAGSICCFIKGGKMNAQKKMYSRFHEYCAVIGMRTRVPLRELAKVSEMDRNEVRQYLQKMIAAGYFGGSAYLDVSHDELVLPAPAGYTEPSVRSSWRDAVMDLIGALRSEFQSAYTQAKDAPKPEAEREAAAPKPESKPAARPTQPQGKNYMGELEKTLNELYKLNEQIEDEAVSRRIDRIGSLTAGIFRAVIDKPEREQDVRKFMNYYLPTTLKLLKSYDMLEGQSYQGENIAASRKKIENVLDMLIEAYERQLDRLFKNDALDISTDISVLETMLAGDGLSSKGQMKMM